MIRCPENALKEDLKLLVNCHWKPSETIIEEMARNHGLENFNREHEVIFLPPYHPEFNAIEMAWGQIKRYVGQNPPYNLEGLLNEVLPQAFANLTPLKINNICNHIKNKLLEEASGDQNAEDIIIGEEHNVEYQ